MYMYVLMQAAGASFLAFGSSAPEIVIATIATLSATPSDSNDLGGAAAAAGDEARGGEGSSETGLSTVLGSAVLAFGLIPALSAILAPPADKWDLAQTPPELYKGGLLLEMRPLLRDVSFALIGFGLVFYFAEDGVIQQNEAYLLVTGFFVYMAVIFVPIRIAAKATQVAANAGGGSGLLAQDHGIGLPTAVPSAPASPAVGSGSGTLYNNDGSVTPDLGGGGGGGSAARGASRRCGSYSFCACHLFGGLLPLPQLINRTPPFVSVRTQAVEESSMTSLSVPTQQQLPPPLPQQLKARKSMWEVVAGSYSGQFSSESPAQLSGSAS